MSAHLAPKPLGGKIFTPGFNTLLTIGAIGMAILAYRMVFGLGAMSNMSDGYPWGIWIAFDVVTGTAIACGGYSVALMIYILNKGQYHPLIRPAVLTTALGYTIAGLSVIVDLGRWWNVWNLALVWKWNGNSVLLEVALCIMSYVVVSWLEVSEAMWEKWGDTPGTLGRFSKWITPILHKALPFLIALGILLPTMHQSSLGALHLISTKLHPLWHSAFLPLMFLITVVGMGYAGVVLEGTIATLSFRLPAEWSLLAKLSKGVSYTFFAFVALRVLDLLFRGLPGFGLNGFTLLFLFEIALFLAAAVFMLDEKKLRNPGWLFGNAILALFAGALYRFDVFLVAFDPGPNWHYFPSIGETMVTVSLVALEMAAYMLIVKLFPILRPARS